MVGPAVYCEAYSQQNKRRLHKDKVSHVKTHAHEVLQRCSLLKRSQSPVSETHNDARPSNGANHTRVQQPKVQPKITSLDIYQIHTIQCI